MLFGKLLAAFSLNNTVGEVCFIGDKNFCNVATGMGFNLLEPVADVVEGCLLSAIVNQNYSHRTFIVGLSNGTEAFLTCSIPDLELHLLTVNVDRLYFEINTCHNKSQ